MSNESFIEFSNVSKTFTVGEVSIDALKDVSFCIEKGEIAVIVGASGAGKTTLLNILGGMDSPTCGNVFIDSENIADFNKKQLTRYRRRDIGFVFQFYNLIPNLTALENVELAVQICRDHMEPKSIIEEVGLKERSDSFPAQLSGGEQQRVAIARALAKNPKLLLCDEPTGALDYVTGKSILKLLQDMGKSTGMTIVIVTHNSALCSMADRVIRVKSGRIESIVKNKNPMSIDLIEW